MANLVKAILGVCAIASAVQAVPLRVLTITDIVTVTTWETINSTSTVWVPANQSPTVTTTSTVVSTSVSENTVAATSASVATPSFAPPAAPPSAPAVPGGQFAQASAPAPLAASASPSTTVAVQPAPASPSTFTTSTVAPPRPTTTPLTTPSTSAAFIPVPQTSAVAASSSGGQCAPGAPCTGDVTHWDGGLGACGWSVNTASDMQIALPVGMMGSQSNGNPFCGRSVTLKNPKSGTTVQATVGDKCMGCIGTSIDCTDALFNAITDGTGDGRVSGMEWWFS